MPTHREDAFSFHFTPFESTWLIPVIWLGEDFEGKQYILFYSPMTKNIHLSTKCVSTQSYQTCILPHPNATSLLREISTNLLPAT